MESANQPKKIITPSARLGNVLQLFHKVKTINEKADFIFDLLRIMENTTSTTPRVLIFFNSKYEMDIVFEEMRKNECFLEIQFQIAQYHGEMDTETRMKLQADFDNGNQNVLLTTNLSARGIDFKGANLAIQCDVPIHLTRRRQKDTGPILSDQIDTKSYLHRIGRLSHHDRKCVSILISSQEGEEQIIDKLKYYQTQIHVFENFNSICEQLNDSNISMTWTRLGVSAVSQEYLIKQQYLAPTFAQVQSISHLLNFKPDEENFYQHISVFNLPSKSGKTLSYLIPIIEKLDLSTSIDWEPQAIIIVNTKQLCLQIGKVLTPEKSEVISYHFKDSQEMNSKAKIIIGTPGSIIGSMRRFTTSKLKFLVLDEADELLDKNNRDLQEITNRIYNDVSPGFQFILYSSTFCDEDFNKLIDVIDDAFFKISDITICKLL